MTSMHTMVTNTWMVTPTSLDDMDISFVISSKNYL